MPLRRIGRPARRARAATPLRRPGVTTQDCFATVWAGLVPATIGVGVYALLGGVGGATDWQTVMLLSASALIAAGGNAIVALGLFDVLRAQASRLRGVPLPQPVGRALVDGALRTLGL